MVVFRAEVVIVGGGILGCWVLRELVTRGYGSTVLLEHDRLGCRQTGHADAFLHHGYAYYRRSLARSFGDTSAYWNPYPSTNPPIPAGTGHHVYLRAAWNGGTSEHAAATAWFAQNLWHPLPPLLQPLMNNAPGVGPAHDAIETSERCVSREQVAAQLRVSLKTHFCKVARVERIILDRQVADSPLHVRAVVATLDDDTLLEISPEILLLCAGEQNRDLLRRVEIPHGDALPADFSNLDTLHRAVPMDRIVIRDPSGQLPVFNGTVFGGRVRKVEREAWRNVFSFIVTRTERQEKAWICSGAVSQSHGESMQGPEFRGLLVRHLREVFPYLEEHHREVEWGVYPARLVTLNTRNFSGFNPSLRGGAYLDMGIDRLMVCYADRLTTAPRVAEDVASAVIATCPLTHGVALPGGLPAGTHPEIQPEYWRVPLLWERRGVMRWREVELDCLT